MATTTAIALPDLAQQIDTKRACERPCLKEEPNE